MRKNRNSVLACALACAMSLTIWICPQSFADTASTEQEMESIDAVKENNAVNMLNYLRALAQEIRSSSNSRLILEETYSSLINNTHPNAVDQETLDEVMSLLDTIENYRMISVKRERLEYMYEQNQAKAIRSAVPNPVGLLSAVKSRDLNRLAASIIYMAVDSVTSYKSALSDAELEYLEDGWQLDDKEATELHNSRKGLFTYMVNMVTAYELNGDLALSEEMVDDFVLWKNKKNVTGKIQFFESSKNSYKAYGPYWLELAQCYYQNKDYQKCLDSIQEYYNLNINIFRKDHDLARTLPIAICAADEILTADEYANKVNEFCQDIIENTDNDEWNLRFFAADAYVNLYIETKNDVYLKNAYSIVVDNINELVDEQKRQNSTFLADVKKEDIPKGTTKAKKNEIEKYNNMVIMERETELAPLYEPLILNCDLLMSICNEMDLSDAEKKRLDRILHNNYSPLFLVPSVDQKYWFTITPETVSSTDVDIVFNSDTLTIPAEYVTNDAMITVAVNNKDKKTTEFSDWSLVKVSRADKYDPSSFIAKYYSEEANDYSYQDGDIVSVHIVPRTDYEPYDATFKTTRKKAIRTLSTWAWLDDASKWTDDIKFERISE